MQKVLESSLAATLQRPALCSLRGKRAPPAPDLPIPAMVLLVQGEQVASEALLRHPALLAASERFLAGSRTLTTDAKCLYAHQAEIATCSAAEEVLLCSADATTCVIAVLSATAAAVAGAAAGQPLARVVHHDELTTSSLAALQQTVAGMSRASLWLAGGYLDEGGVGARVVSRLLDFLQRCEAVLEVQLCCVGSHNTAADGSPRSTALALDLRSLAAAPAAPPPARRGPLLPARQGQWAYPREASNTRSNGSSGSPLRSIYCSAAQQLQLRLHQGRPPGHCLWHAAQLLDLPDEQLLQRYSTSPAHEPPNFVEEVRASFRWLLEQSGPVRLATHRFVWSGGEWRALEAAGSNAAAAAAGQLEAQLALA